MKQREQARLLLGKAAQDESLLDEILTSNRVSDEIIGFHCQQAAEKLMKALLSACGVRYRKTHDIGGLMDLLTEAGAALPEELQDIDFLTPFGTIYRYEDFAPPVALDRSHARAQLRRLRRWVEDRLGGESSGESS